VNKQKTLDILRDSGLSNFILSHHGDTIISELAEALKPSNNSAMVPCQKHVEYKSYFEMLRYRLCPYCGFDLAQHQ
jgi:hypothetical protein